MLNRLLSVLRLSLLFLLLAPALWAGGGPERTLLVVNEASPLSLRVAHRYQDSRVHTLFDEILLRESEPQTGKIAAQGIRVSGCGLGNRGRVASIVPRDDLQNPGAIP